MYDNIAAISSGSHINQPISIVRLSGPDAKEIISKIYRGKLGSDHNITYGNIYDGDNLVDEVLVMWFLGKQNPDGTVIYNNYVGEPLIEINCHGGIIVTNKVLELLLQNGARLADKGEFTRRAFLNGKMDLVKAEAIHDLIMAQTTSQASASVNKFKGKTSHMIDDFLKEIALLIGICEVNIDYPEYEDIEQIDNDVMINKLDVLIKKLSEIVKVSEDSRYVFEGVKVAFLGKPNVGKSSILNSLLSEDKAIVTDIAGTTRDLVEATYKINDMLFKLVDTAGLRKTDEKIEQIGIKKSLEQIEKSDLVVHVTDTVQGEDEFDKKVEQKAKKLGKFYIKVLNKIDLDDSNTDENIVKISAKLDNISALEQALVSNFANINIFDERIFSNTRQLSLIKQSLDSLNNAKNSLLNYYTFDVVIIDLYAAWDSLQNIKGNVNREDLLDVMFSNFCLGK
ncbi:tRNA uridine-5-carboxymethylaminomethyl(34) synthesis GTPase MnmE [Mycoplasmopsis verecunda]|uniref:tRNA modification GTPase MnmE n=1 Tax=Mycoplasmopsis verecunda TaxID=171291 RepID=A0A1T4KYN7_9BACT|nr:tRNA uridine-5-carboxymethylaminomethyl(34) synthesis GTPase MnmE [Mycoplasmopsis verecunda]WPB54356.1 tRNA uridine-5-carboxymethylaminomethyl(34) synthesis GTPase MnmE [Mycoplasmopsis verecunda]SJZ47539.1 tRNA modification GTPase [Mycoplasmopsis verecunda]